MPRHLHHSLALVTTLAAACGDVTKPAVPRVIAGGGIGDGKITGTLFVHVTDDDTRAPVSSANVRVGEASAANPCEVLTDSTGLATFDATNCPMLKGPVTVTASASGYAPATWIGANGTNLTVPIRPRVRPTIDSATVSGTIAGWDSLPAPAPNHMLLGLVGFSQTRNLGDPANEMVQGTRTVNVMIGAVTTPQPVPANVCVRRQETLASVNDCNWQLKTRTGAQALYAIIIDQDTKGTEADTDDTQTVVGWAIKTNETFGANEQATGKSLELITDANMQAFTAAFASPPSGMDYVGAFPMLDIGDSGRIPVFFPALDLTHTMTRVPKVAGQLANAKYDLVAMARDAMDQEEPASIHWLRGVDPSATVEVKAWMLPPTALSTAGGMFSFTPAAGASVHSAELNDAGGARAWSISIFNGATSFTLPGVSPDPLPLGTVRYKVTAMKIPGVDLGNVVFDDVVDKVTDMSSDEVSYTR
jgi:hypothetical protein